jgi:hypothetical protein
MAVALVFSSAALAMDCGKPTLGLDAGREHSHWAERDAQGATVLTERGWLDRVALAAGGQCGAATWEAQ